MSLHHVHGAKDEDVELVAVTSGDRFSKNNPSKDLSNAVAPLSSHTNDTNNNSNKLNNTPGEKVSNAIGAHLSPAGRITLCTGGVFACYIVHDYVQELVFENPKFQFGWFMTLFELGVFVVSSWSVMTAKGTPIRAAIPHLKHYTILTFLIAATQGFGTAAINFVNYPVKVVVKSCKLIPTMVLGLCIGRHFSFIEYCAAISLCLGVVGFLLVDAATSPKFSITGIVFLGVAVVGDALTANSQEFILRQHERPKDEMIFVSNGMGMLVVLLVCIVTGELVPALQLCIEEPTVLALLLLQALAGYFGVGFYLSLVEGFGGALAVSVTTCRKVATVAISFIVLSKPFNVMYLPTGAVIIFGIWLSTQAKKSRSSPTSTKGKESE